MSKEYFSAKKTQMLRTGSLTRVFPFSISKTSHRGAAALGLPPAKPLDVVIAADDEISACGKVASQIDDLLIIQVRGCGAAQFHKSATTIVAHATLSGAVEGHAEERAVCGFL